MTENWRPIPGYEGRYDVSHQGRVRSWHRYRGEPGPRPVKAVPGGNGYLKVRLTADGRGKTWNVHQLVAAAFLGPRPNGYETRHRDGNHMHNHLSNLRYGTRSENAQDSIRHGTNAALRKTHCPREHPYDAENTMVWADGRRRCRRCHLAKNATWRARRFLRPAATTADTAGRTVAA